MCLAALFADFRISGGAKISMKFSFIEIIFPLCIQQAWCARQEFFCSE